MNVNEWLYQCKSICTKISKEKAVYSSKGCPTAYFDKKFTRSRYHGKTRLHCSDYASWCLQRYKIIPAGQRFWVRGQKVKGVNGKGTKFITKNKKIQRIMIAKKGVPASVLVKRTGTKSLKKGDLVSVVRKSESGNHIQIYAGKQNGKYKVYRYRTIVKYKMLKGKTKSTKYSYKAPKRGTKYTLAVRALNGKKKSAWCSKSVKTASKDAPHVHKWVQKSEKIKSGYACNGCSRDITDWDWEG